MIMLIFVLIAEQNSWKIIHGYVMDAVQKMMPVHISAKIVVLVGMSRMNIKIL